MRRMIVVVMLYEISFCSIAAKYPSRMGPVPCENPKFPTLSYEYTVKHSILKCLRS